MINDDENLARRVRIIARTLSALGENYVRGSHSFQYSEHVDSHIAPNHVLYEPILGNPRLDIAGALMQLLDDIRTNGGLFESSNENPWTQYMLTIWADGRWSINETYDRPVREFGYHGTDTVDLTQYGDAP